MARKIEVELVGDARSLERAFGRARGSSSGLERALRIGLHAATVAAGAGLIALGASAKIGFDEFKQNQRVAAQTNAVLKSTDDVSRVSAKHVDELGKALLDKTGIDDEVIRSGENLLLTFTNIRNEAGAGGKVFDRTTRTLLDMSVALGRDLAPTARIVGKVLQDPIKNMGALGRVGITFSKSQTAVIKKLAETGKLSKAQGIILSELEKRFKGSAEAAGKTFPGQLDILRERFKNFAGDLLARALPVLDKVVGALSSVVAFIGQITNAPSLKVALDIGGEGLKNLGERIKTQIQSAINSTNWSEVGRQLASAIGAGISFTDQSVNHAVGSLIAALNAHSQDFAELAATIGLKIVTTLTDPSFWIHHWKLAAVIGLTVFGGELLRGVGAIASKIGGAFFTRFLASRIATIGSVLLLQFERLPAGVQRFALAAARLLSGAFVAALEAIRGKLGALMGALGRVGGAIKLAFKIGAIVSVWGAIQTAIDKVKALLGWLKKLVEHAWDISIHVKVPGGFPHIPIPHIPTPPIPHLQSGGAVPGRPGEAVPIVAHAGEIVLNPAQQQMLGGPRFLSQLFGFHRERGPGSSMASGGKVGKGHKAPRLPGPIREAEARAAGTPGLADDIAAYGRDLQWTNSELGRKDLTKGERESLRVHRIRVRNRLKSLRRRQKIARQRASTDINLPARIRLAQANARLTPSLADDIAAKKMEIAWYKAELAKKPGIERKIALENALADAQDELQNLQDQSASDTGGGQDTADLQAELDQARQQAAVFAESARLANTFVATGVFGSDTGGGGQGGGMTVIFQHLIPDADQIARATARIAEGAGRQPYRSTGVVRTGY